MSNWITENKPAAVVAGTGLLLFLGLATVGYLANSERSGLDKQITVASRDIKTANAAELTPSKATNTRLSRELAHYDKAVKQLEAAYVPFQASSALAPITPTAFQNELKAFRDTLIAACKEKNIQITDTSSWLGFQIYSTQAPSVQAAPTLGFEMKAINTLVTRLADCGLTKFIKVYRSQLPVENTAPAPEGEENVDSDIQATWSPMPLEIAFQGDRNSVLKAMNAITESKDYLFTINSIRVRNERMMPPPIAGPEPAKTAAAQPPAAAAGDLRPADEAAAATAAPPVQELIKPYMGKEQILVQVSLNLVHFQQPKNQEPAND